MLEGKAIIREAEMEEGMQMHAMELAYQALDLYEVSDFISIAQHIKLGARFTGPSWQTLQKFDEAYRPAWHCVVGVNFGSCITHLSGSFIFFHVDKMEFLVFKDSRAMEESKEEAIGEVELSLPSPEKRSFWQKEIKKLDR